jgi:hypothetical protein
MLGRLQHRRVVTCIDLGNRKGVAPEILLWREADTIEWASPLFPTPAVVKAGLPNVAAADPWEFEPLTLTGDAQTAHKNVASRFSPCGDEPTRPGGTPWRGRAVRTELKRSERDGHGVNC